MRIKSRYTGIVSPLWAAIAVLACLTGASYAQKNVIQPGDPLIASSANNPPSEAVANVIDGTQAKYLNFDLANDAKAAGFIVTPSVGPTWVTGVAMQSANDAADRDPKEITIEGSNDDTISDWSSGNWEVIYHTASIPAWTDVFPGGSNVDRYKWQTFTFANFKPYKHYRWTVIHTQGPSTCCMQIAEVQLLGTTVPKNVVQPGDPLIASSANNPPSEAVANVIDGTQAKYLNFDMANDAKPAGFIVTSSVGATVINGVSMLSANDAADRDPKSITIEGSNDDTVTAWSGGNWTTIYANENIPAWTDVFPGGSNVDRYKTQTFLFANVTPYKHYRWTVLKTQGPSTCCLQIAEVQLLGSGAPVNVILPSDTLIASSANNPPSEAVANVIDGTQAKYLNFDMANDAKPAGFIVTPAVGPTTITSVGMLSANDAADRDPKSITIEGSNDDTVSGWSGGNWTTVYANENIPAWTDVYPGGSNVDRYKWQYFYFNNGTAYKHYRWTVLKTQGPSTCCLQIAEVQLLAVTSQADCSKAKFILQPVETPVLSGSQAEFYSDVNGPWPLQWFANDVAVPGANQKTYITPVITAANASIAYSVAIVGCETSAPVHAVIFKPSATKSIGIHFVGSGANGAPTYMNIDDIAGVQKQAYWINATNATGTTADSSTLPDKLWDSDNNPTDIIFDYTTSGAWGSGSGDGSPTARLLNGIVGATGPGTDQTMAFHGVPAGSHAVLIYAVSPPKQVQVTSYSINGGPKIYQRTMNSDEYKVAPGFYRATSTSQANPTVGDFVRFDGVQPDAAGDINLVFAVVAGAERETGVSAIQLVLNAPNPGAPPTVTLAPPATVAPENGAAVLTVQASGSDLTYQWRKNGSLLPSGGHVSGVATATLTISPFTAEDVGIYSVAIFNPAGSTVSRNASVQLSKYDIKDQLAGYWKFNETSGSSAANSVSGALPAILQGTASWVKGEVDNAFSFDGGSYMVVSNYTKASKGIAASAWVNVPSNPGSDLAIIQNAEPNLYTVGGAGTHIIGQFEMTLVNDASGILLPEAAIGIGPAIAKVTATTAFPLGGWHHIAFSADGAQVVLYVDGKQVGFVDYLSDISAPDVPFITIGAKLNDDGTGVIGPDGTAPAFLVGPIDETAVWTRALTADEVSKIYAAGKAGKALDTVAETPPVVITGGKLTVSQSGGNITVTWDKGALQTAPSVNGLWTPVTATSPVTEKMSDTAKFYRTANQ